MHSRCKGSITWISHKWYGKQPLQRGHVTACRKMKISHKCLKHDFQHWTRDCGDIALIRLQKPPTFSYMRFICWKCQKNCRYFSQRAWMKLIFEKSQQYMLLNPIYRSHQRIDKRALKFLVFVFGVISAVIACTKLSLLQLFQAKKKTICDRLQDKHGKDRKVQKRNMDTCSRAFQCL